MHLYSQVLYITLYNTPFGINASIIFPIHLFCVPLKIIKQRSLFLLKITEEKKFTIT